jgi:hypothetical protein
VYFGDYSMHIVILGDVLVTLNYFQCFTYRILPVCLNLLCTSETCTESSESANISRTYVTNFSDPDPFCGAFWAP